MKAFHSPLISVARLTSQQVNLQKLTLARIAQQEAELQKKFTEIEEQMRTIEAGMIDSIRNSRDTNLLISLRAASDQLQEIRDHADQLTNELNAQRQQQESVYRTLSARESSLNKLLTQQRAEHRKKQLALEQVELDQSFASCRTSVSNPS